MSAPGGGADAIGLEADIRAQLAEFGIVLAKGIQHALRLVDQLGFNRAIVVLEEGCEAFSNIEGLGQIRFPKGNIKAAFEEIRQVLEREGLLSVDE